MWIYTAIGALSLTGAALALYVVKRVIETVVFLRAATRTVGTVVRLDAARNSDGHQMYLPVFEYQTGDGRRFRHTSTVASTPPAYQIGETVTILYLKKNPQNARLKSFTELWLSTLVLAVISFVSFAGALIILIAQQ